MQLHRHTDHLAAGFHQQRGGNRGIDATDFEGGETMDTFAVRVLAALEEIAGIARGVRVTAASADGCLLVISHGWVLDVLTRHIRGLPRSAMLGVKPKNGECLWLEVSHEGRIQALGG